MKTILITLLISLTLINYVLSVNYNYITNDDRIISGDSHNRTVIDLPKEAVALIIYENNVNKTGWANLELKTLNGFSYEDQAYKAGVLEGYITGQLIHWSYRNLIEGVCDDNKKFCKLLTKFTENNNKFVNEMIAKNPDNAYWYQLDLINKQIKGLQKGYNLWKSENHVKNPPESLYLGEILWLNLIPELSDLQRVLTPELQTIPHRDHCSAIVKLLADGSDLFVSHNTWTTFESMLRIVKKYSFAFNTIQSNFTKLVSGHSVAFSSYPGLIFSMDDYYILSSGLVVQETTNANNNFSSYSHIHPNNIVFEFIRNVAANRLANSGKEWTDLFGQYNSGTYNNQFMIVDYKLFKKGTKLSDLPNNLLWITEQMPGITQSADVTQVLRDEGYWGSYNVPYFKDIYELSGEADLFRQKGPFYSHNETARALIFRRDQTKVTDIKTLYALMRYNDFKHDLLSRCETYDQECSPPYSAGLAIASRSDLNDKKGKYPIEWWAYDDECATDVKITNSSMVLNLEMLVVSGPTDQQQPAFRWSTSDLDAPHYGHPDLFNFKPIYIKWFPNTYQTAKDIDNNDKD